MGMFSGWIDQAIALRFRKDASGRLVFLPFGPRKPGYYADAPSDEPKLKSLVKMYTVAAALINLMGSLGSYAITQATVVHNRSVPLAKELENALAAYSISVLVLLILPAWLLWKTYRGLIKELCASLSPVGPESIREMEKPSLPFRRRLIIISVGLMIVGLAIAVAATQHAVRCK